MVFSPFWEQDFVVVFLKLSASVEFFFLSDFPVFFERNLSILVLACLCVSSQYIYDSNRILTVKEINEYKK